MTSPPFWNTARLETIMAGGPTAADVILELVDQFTVQLPVDERWTLVAADTYESPAEPGGRKLRLKITDLAPGSGAEGMQFKFGQDASWFYDGSLRWRTGLDDVYVLSGKGHACVMTSNGPNAVPETAYACILDHSPLKPNSSASKVVGRVPRDINGNAFWLVSAIAMIFMLDGDGVQPRTRIIHPFWLTGDGYFFETVDGQMLHSYVPIGQYPSYVANGAPYQLALVSRDILDFAVVSLRVDQGVDGNFRVIPLPRSYACKMAIRIPD